MSEQVQCNCEWNPDSHAKTCPVYLQQMVDALHAEAEALRAALLGIASVNPAERGIEWAKSYASDGLKGSGSELYARWLDTFKEAEALRDQNRDLRIEADGWFSRVNGVEAKLEALRAENEKWQRSHRDIYEPALRDAHSYIQELRAELEAARGLLRDANWSMCSSPLCQSGVIERCCCRKCVHGRIDAYLTANPAPEVRQAEQRWSSFSEWLAWELDQGDGTMAAASDAETRLARRLWFCLERTALAEQGERQEPFVWMRPDGDEFFELTSEGDYLSFPLYTTPQPGPDVRALAASLYQACGAYDMPERILDALSAAANGEPFTHMIDGLLPCVPPSEQDVRALVEALENCAAAIAWNCFGECRAIHAGPIMPAAMALDTARAALATHRQAHPQ
jgi:hypothetical protein